VIWIDASHAALITSHRRGESAPARPGSHRYRVAHDRSTRLDGSRSGDACRTRRRRAYYHGDFDGPANSGSNAGNIHFFIYALQASYYVADGWEAFASLPYIEENYHGNFPHPILACLQPGGPPCAPVRTDNGSTHGTLQDWDVGMRYHVEYAGYYIAPVVELVVPSHNYPYYGTGFGERNTQLGLGLDMTHQFDFSNFYYRAHAEYFFNQHKIGIDNDYYTFGFDLGYFISPKLGVKVLTDVRLGNGLTDAEIGPPRPDPDFIYHDKFRLQEHGLIGAAANYLFTDRYALQVTLEHAVWGRSNGDMRFGLDVKLTRSF
jgi:hypothetical protein